MQASETIVKYSPKLKPKDCVSITNSRDAAVLVRSVIDSMGHLEHREVFIVLLLNKRNRVLGWHLVSIGGISATFVDPKIIFQVALKCNASSVILSHNHPSGHVQPSKEDESITKKLVEGGKVLEISVLDHIIVSGEEDHYSFADEGLI
jgi:DNA repair protein RadC